MARRWQEPDAGIWEIEPRAWTHSRLSAAAGLRAVAAIPDQHGAAGERSALADRIVADTATHALHPSGRWQRAADDPGLDAALLLPPLRGALPMEDPRSVSTFHAYLAALTHNGYAYRFRHDDRPLADAEGAFLLCGFLVALTHHRLGNHVEARSWYDTTRSATGAAQLFSEEYDAVQHQMRGNLPQAFVHALHLEDRRHTVREDARRPRRRGRNIVMQEIPKPELLDPDRVDRDDREDMTTEDHRSQKQLLAKALGESCSYADQLWEQLNQVRAYLLDSLPPDPDCPVRRRLRRASPTGPDDEQGWQRWMATFADTTSVLCGAHGDSGFGLSTAKEEAQVRRTAPVLTLQHASPAGGRSCRTGADLCRSCRSATASGKAAGAPSRSPARWSPRRSRCVGCGAAPRPR